MSTTIDLDGIAKIVVEREYLGEYHRTVLRLVADDGTTVNVDAGRFHDAAEHLATQVSAASAQAAEILRTWEDDPDEFDGYIGLDHGRWYAVLEPGSRGAVQVENLPTRTIAIIELARLMADAGCFPNAWDQGTDWNRDIGDEVRAFHDDGGDKMRPLRGAVYEDDAAVWAYDSDGRWSAYVVRDYGEHGIVYVLSGDDTHHHTTNRRSIRRRSTEET